MNNELKILRRLDTIISKIGKLEGRISKVEEGYQNESRITTNVERVYYGNSGGLDCSI